ncbi:MAG: Fur family transcriptional regulator [Chloroflexota bacterium]
MNEKPCPQRTSQWLDCLQSNGYRLTAPRQAVVDIVASSQRVLTPLEVYELARARYPRLGLVTVYRTMEKLEELGLLQRVHQPSGCQGFIAAFTGHQHLLICQACGMVEFFDGSHDKIDAMMEDVAQKSGYHIQDHWLQFFGLCRGCRGSTD